jgi:2-polyprenyl-3-methyl-5-hydroxy-6-metoxy-1,4-benzoquinol methylase
VKARGVTALDSSSGYALGHTEVEHQRLIRQAKRYAPLTERLFREAGVGPGQRVLDLGSGVGDVAIVAAGIVGSSGEVVGIERDARAIASARARAAQAGLVNVRFIQSDADQVKENKSFDALIGRFILQFIPDPAVVLRSISHSVRPGGVVVFQEISWAPSLKVNEHLRLWSACAGVAHETMKRSGANTDMGLALHRVFLDAGLPAPRLKLEMLLGVDPDLTRWIYDLLQSLQPKISQAGLTLDAVGDLNTLQERLHAEVVASKGPVASPGLVGGWCTIGPMTG